MARRISVRGIVLQGNKLLCVKLKPYEGSLRKQGTEYWCLPGGGLEDNESLVVGITREMIEETGITPVVGRLLYIQQFVHESNEFLEFFFHITNSDAYEQVDLSKTTHGEKEIAAISFIEPAQAYVLPKFLSTEDLQAFAMSNEPVRIMNQLV